MKIGIQIKITFCILLGISLATIGYFISSKIIVEKIFTKEMLNTSQNITKYLAEDIMNPLLITDLSTINLIIYRAKQQDEKILYIFLTAPDEEIIASTLKNDLIYNLAKSNQISTTNEYNIKYFHNEGAEFYDVAYKLLKGTLHIGFSTKKLLVTIKNFTKQLIMLFFIISLISIGLTLYVTKYITSPLKYLIYKMEEISKGNLAIEIPITQKDEIGILGKTFNKMIHDLKESRDKIEDYNKNLELKVEERTKELKETQEKLLQSSKMAAIGQLAGGVAHEINNPMGVILGFAQSVVKGIKEEDSLYMPLKSIEREALRCKKLIGDLLTFSRVSKTKVSETNVNIAIDEALSLVEAQAKVKSVQIIKEYGDDLLKIITNQNQIQQVIINLCNNAIDSMSDGGTIKITTRNVIASETKQSHIEISISDTGSGIPEDVKSRIFEPFFTTKEVGKGTGLGLSLCYEIIQKHNGTIEVKSEIGKGTTFIMKLPV